MIGTWKAGGIVVSINPMSRQRELTTLLSDCEATALLAEEDLFGQVAAEVVPTIPSLRIAWTTSPLEYQTRHDPRLFAVDRARAPRGHRGPHRGARPPSATAGPSRWSSASTTSPSSATRRAPPGPPKGAMNTHRNVVFNARTYRDWIQLGPEDSVLGVAPLFHITGVIGHLAIALLVPIPLVLAYRFEPQVVLDAIREHRADLLDRLDHGVHRADERRRARSATTSRR